MPVAALVSTKTVLVADDTAFVRDRFRTALAGAGYRAITLRSGSELLLQIRDDHSDIDLVVLDLRLPHGRGVELVRAIRHISGFNAPVVVFSGTIADAEEVRALAELGIAGYVNEYTAVQHIVPALTPYLFPERHDRRTSPRVTLGIPVAYRFGNTIATGVTLSVSHGGVAVRTTSPLDADAVVRVRFRLPGASKEVEADARVAWAECGRGMGLEFTHVVEPDQRVIDDFVRSHFFSNRKA